MRATRRPTRRSGAGQPAGAGTGRSSSWGRRGAKYGAVPTVVDGMRFSSKAEARRYGELLLLGLAGEIRNLELQPRFDLHAPNGTRIGAYIADFKFSRRSITGQWVEVVEDVKSQPTKTAIYRWKKRHVEAEYGVRVEEV